MQYLQNSVVFLTRHLYETVFIEVVHVLLGVQSL